MSNLYYVVENEVIDHGNGAYDLTGNKIVTVYETANDTPKAWFDIEIPLEIFNRDNESTRWVPFNEVPVETIISYLEIQNAK